MSNNILYTQLDSGIHRVTWPQDISRQSVDDYIELFAQIMDDSPANSILRVLHDYENVPTPSFSAMASGMKRLVLREDIIIRIAHIYNDVSFPMIVKNATMVARFDVNRKFFKVDEAQEAIDWLLNDD